MAPATDTTNGTSGPGTYDITVKGHIEDRWSELLSGMELTRDDHGATRLTGELPDQAALHGMLAQLRDLGLPILSVERRSQTDMIAVTQERYGGPEVLSVRRIERPTPGAGQLLVRVRAAGVDRGTWHLLTGQPYVVRVMGFGLRGPRQRIPGMDFAGVVEATGPGVTRFEPGDEVFGTCSGSFAEYALVLEGQAEPKPSNVTFEEAATIPVSGLAAYQAIHHEAKVQPGQDVLIVGASGGVGSFAVQLARVAGATVTGVASGAKAAFVRSLGATHVIDYTREDFTRTGRRYDAIIDLAGNRPLSHLRRALAPRGTLVITGGEHGGRLLGGQLRPVTASLLSPFVRQNLRWQMPRDQPGDLARLKELVDSGDLRPSLDRSFPLDRAADAIRYLAEGRPSGKVALSV